MNKRVGIKIDQQPQNVLGTWPRNDSFHLVVFFRGCDNLSKRLMAGISKIPQSNATAWQPHPLASSP